jgi:hypothetical protein
LTEKLAQYQKRLASAYFEYLNIREDINRPPDYPPPENLALYLLNNRHGLRSGEDNIDAIGDLILAESKEVDIALTALLSCNQSKSHPIQAPKKFSLQHKRKPIAENIAAAAGTQRSCQEFPAGVHTEIDFDDYKYWIRFPVPVAAVPPKLLERFDSKDIEFDKRKEFYRSVLFSHWVERISDFRCRVFLECMTTDDRKRAKKQIEDSFDARTYKSRHLKKPEG